MFLTPRRYLNYYATKSLSQSSHPPHSHFFNHFVILGYFPTDWKSAKIIPIPKPGKPPFDSGSHRPTGLLCNLSTLLERVVAHRLNSFIHQNHILPPGQFGFRQQHSTVCQLARITDFIALHKHTRMVLLDIEKACDTVWLNGPLFKLLSFHMPDDLLSA